MTDQYNIQFEDLPEDFQEIAEAIGFEATLKLVKVRGGEGLYIPKVEKVYRAARDRASPGYPLEELSSRREQGPREGGGRPAHDGSHDRLDGAREGAQEALIQFRSRRC